VKLLNPGPVTLTERVRRALLRDDACHREPDFADLARRVRARVLQVYPAAAATHTLALLTASGTGAVEAMLGSLVPRDGLALVVANGVYGERAAQMLAAHRTPHEVVASPWTSAMDVDAVVRRLDAPPAPGAVRPTHVFAVHHETTTGRLNDVAALGAACKARGVPLLLDAVSSFGAEAIDFDAWSVTACAATANKCLHGVPGLSFVVVARAALEAHVAAPSVYLDLRRYAAPLERGEVPFTPGVQALFALDEALGELEDGGGAPARLARYRGLSARLRAGLAAVGIETLLDEQAYASMLTSFRMPRGVAYATLHDRLRAAGFVIYAGQGRFEGEVFRVAVMGDVGEADVDRLVAEIAALIRSRAP
jgi:2-aminoethylphosphonate-pyruvate transaminase